MEKAQLRRHDMLFLTAEGKRLLLQELRSAYHGIRQDMIEEIFEGAADIPGFVRRDDRQDEKIAIGFVHPLKIDGNRFRVAARVSEAYVRKTWRPYEVSCGSVMPRHGCVEAAKFMQNYAEEKGLQVGVLGSAALEIVTGLAYTDRDSDLDLLVKPASLEKLEALYKTAAARYPDVPLDFEVELPNGFGVKLRELFMDTGTVLGKSLASVDLLDKKEVLAFLKN